MRVYLWNVLAALRGVDLVPYATLESAIRLNAADILRLTAERNENRDLYVDLLAECKRHRDATWKITHR